MRLSASFIAALHDEVSRAVHVEREARGNDGGGLAFLDQRRSGQFAARLEIGALVHGERDHAAERGLVDAALRARRRRGVFLYPLGGRRLLRVAPDPPPPGAELPAL